MARIFVVTVDGMNVTTVLGAAFTAEGAKRAAQSFQDLRLAAQTTMIEALEWHFNATIGTPAEEQYAVSDDATGQTVYRIRPYEALDDMPYQGILTTMKKVPIQGLFTSKQSEKADLADEGIEVPA